MAKLSVSNSLRKANSKAKQGEIVEAIKLYQAVLKAFPENKQAKKGLANLNNKLQIKPEEPLSDSLNSLVKLYEIKDFTRTIEVAKNILNQQPNLHLVWNILGAANMQLREFEKAESAFKKFLQLKPDDANGYNNLGKAFKNQGKLLDSIESYKKAIVIQHNYSEAYYNMGCAFQEKGEIKEAIKSYKHATYFKSDYLQAYTNLAKALQQQEQNEEALNAYEKIISIEPECFEAYINIGNILQHEGEFDRALQAYKNVLNIRKNEPVVHMNMGVVYGYQGDEQKAEKAYKTALTLKPDLAPAHMFLSQLKKYNSDSPQVKLVRQLLTDDGLSDEDRCYLNFAMAKMQEDINNIEDAYNHYVTGGELRKKLLNYNLKQDLKVFKKIKKTAEKFKGISVSAKLDKPLLSSNKFPIPIFILGMPRSGTTLVEQILSSHSLIHGAGELSYIGQYGKQLALGFEEVKLDSITSLRNRYLQKLNSVGNGLPFVTDKTPQNFLYIGLIFSVFPNARIIHVKRNAAATCWSNFKSYFFAKGLEYSNDLQDLVQYYKLYLDLMDYWNNSYYENIYHLDYEVLTINQEEEIQKLFSFLGLDLEEACLMPHKSKRVVKTTSLYQVRKKVYTGSSEVWLKFEPFLNGIFDGL